MKTLLALMFAAFSGIALAGGGDKITEYDTNGDGQLSRDEASADAKIAAQFVQLDVNGDGLLDADELDKGATDDIDEVGADPIDQ